MRLPTPSSCLLDGVEGEDYGFDGVLCQLLRGHFPSMLQ